MKDFIVIFTDTGGIPQIVPITAESAEKAREEIEKLPYCETVDDIYQKVEE